MRAASIDPTPALLADPGLSMLAGALLWGLLLGLLLLLFRAGR